MLSSILKSDKFAEAKGQLVFTFGRHEAGDIVLDEFVYVPHFLVFGTPQLPPTEVLNAIILSLMYKYSPKYVNFLVVDTLGSGLCCQGTPYAADDAIQSAESALVCMDELIAEMNLRYRLFRANGVFNHKEYNKLAEEQGSPTLPYIVLVVDEIADLVAVRDGEFAMKLQSLAQKCRAAGIHLLLGTRHADDKLIGGDIRCNLPGRIVLRQPNAFASRLALDEEGAEALAHPRDVLYRPNDYDPPLLVHLELDPHEVAELVQLALAKAE